MAFTDWSTVPIDITVKCELGKRWIPRFFCDDSTTVYTTKAPVAKLIMPLIAYPNENIAWDVGESSHATGTIDDFDLEFGGTTNTGDISGQAFTSPTGNIQYTAVGEYEVTLTVTDTLGLVSQPARHKIKIIDESDIIVARIYIATDDEGMYRFDNGDAQISSANTGLSGDDLNIVMGRLNPRTRSNDLDKQHYWACTGNGLIYSTDGCDTWNTITRATMGNPANTAEDATPPETDDLYEAGLFFDIKDANTIHVLRLTDSTWNASNSPRAFRYTTKDYGLTWESKGLGV